jgi:predicted lipoprotein with Yx(FWY)xxD motif
VLGRHDADRQPVVACSNRFVSVAHLRPRDGEGGRTLYLFMKDTANTSVCSAGCAQTWPALLVTGTPTGGAGVDASKLSTTSRTDGGTQVTYNQHPLYHFSGDSAPGDTKGQGIGGNWFVVSPAGEPIQS